MTLFNTKVCTFLIYSMHKFSLFQNDPLVNSIKIISSPFILTIMTTIVRGEKFSAAWPPN